MADDSDVSEVELSDDEAAGNYRRTSRAPRPSDHTEASTESGEQQYSRPLRSISVSAPANSWQDVDREQLSQTVLRLISSVAQTAPTDDKSRDAVWHPTTTIALSQNLNDPLGFGVIDVANMQLVPHEEDQQSQQNPQHPQPTAAHTHGKGAVGRFFSELTKGPSTTKPNKTQSTKPSSGSTSRRPQRSVSVNKRVFGNIPVSRLLPSEEGFDGEAYLAVFHAASTAGELAAGLRALERELGESTGQLKQLVKQNFDRFISCKTTIDDIYTKLQHLESTSTGISTEVLYQAIQEVQSGASRVFGPILERSAKADRIRSVQLLLRRFQSLFSAPDRITALAAARNFEQVTAEYRKATGLIKPGPKTAKVWGSLYAEIEKRVAEIYTQLRSEVSDPDLGADVSSDLVQHMLQLQAEGLAAAAGDDPLALLLAAREAQFTAAMQAVTADHERAMASIRSAMAAAAAADEKLQDSAAITDQQLLKQPRSPDYPGLISETLDYAAAAAAAGSSGWQQQGLLGSSSNSSRHLADLAPLSGLQPPPPQSRIVRDTQCTPGEILYLRYLHRQSSVLLDCLPGLWQATGAGAGHKLLLPPGLPAAAAAKIQSTVSGATKILDRLVSTYADSARHIITALAATGPLRNSLVTATHELSKTLSHLESQKAPAAAVAAVLGSSVGLGVQGLVGHLGCVAGWLVSHEAWQLSVTHSGAQPITQLPEQLQEEVTVAMQYYQRLLAAASTHSSSSSSTTPAAASRIIPADTSTKPIRDAYFACLEDIIKCIGAAANHMRPAGTAASSQAAATRSSSTIGPTTYDPMLIDSDDDNLSDPAAAAAAGSNAAAAAATSGAILRPQQLTDDVRLLLMASNLSFMRSRLVGSLTQRFLLVLTGEVAAEVERCSRYVVKLAGRLDTAVQAINSVYLERKKRSTDRLLSNYIKSDGSPVGCPPELREVSTAAQQLVTLVETVMSETYTYARSSMQPLLHAALEHIGNSLSTAFASLPTAAAAAAAGGGSSTAAAGGGGGCPVESLGQYFMDLVYLDATLSKAGPPSFSVDVTAAYQLLATRICGSSSSISSGRTAETPLARSLMAIREPLDLSRKLQVTCRKVLRDVLERQSFTLRSLLVAPATSAAAAAAAAAGASSSA